MHCAQPFNQQCPSCGQDVPSMARFCPHCAHALTPSGAEASGHISGPLPSGPIAVAAQQSAGLPSPAEASRQARMEGETLLKANHPEQALVAFEQAIQLDASNARAYLGKGDALNKLKHYEEALAAFDQAIALDPAYAVGYGNKGVALFQLQRHQEALTCFDQGIQRDPTDAVIYNNRGAVLRTLGRYEDALASFEQAIQLTPGYVSAHNGKGHVLEALGRYEDAQAAFDWANRLKAGASGPVAAAGAAQQSATPAFTSRSASVSNGASSFSNLSTGSILALIGGGLCLLAFFLPWFSLFVFSISLFSLLTASNQNLVIPGLWLGWLEPLLGVVLIYLALNAPKMGRIAHNWNLAAAVGGLGLLLYAFVQLSSASKDISPTSYLGIGYWLAGVGFVLGVVGAIKGQNESA
jgi:tetratricopeptide (TPR) repeat protein